MACHEITPNPQLTISHRLPNEFTIKQTSKVHHLKLMFLMKSRWRGDGWKHKQQIPQPSQNYHKNQHNRP